MVKYIELMVLHWELRKYTFDITLSQRSRFFISLFFFSHNWINSHFTNARKFNFQEQKTKLLFYLFGFPYYGTLPKRGDNDWNVISDWNFLLFYFFYFITYDVINFKFSSQTIFFAIIFFGFVLFGFGIWMMMSVKWRRNK